MIHLVPHELGVVLPVRAQPGARENAIKGERDESLKVSVTQVAVKGKANLALRNLISKKLGLRKSQVELISGETSAQKRFLVRDVSIEELRQRIEDCLERSG